MKKSLSLLVAIAMVFSMFASVAFAADNATEKTAQEKYDALVAAGIFEGMPDGEAHLDDNMTRAQAAKIVALLTGYTDGTSVPDAGFTDLVGAGWATDYINYVASIGIVNGMGNDKFAPSAEVTTEQLAKMVIEALGFLGQDVPDGDAVDGTVSDWAKDYVAAAVAAGLLTAQDDYTVPATRDLLVVSAYTAYEAAMSAGEVTVSAAATGAKKITVTFNKAVSKEDATIKVTNNNVPVNVKNAVWADDMKSVELEFGNVLAATDYVVTISGLSDDALTSTVTVEAEKVAKIEFQSTNAPLTRGMDDQLSVAYVVTNQYGENITSSTSLTATASKGSAVASNGVVTIDASSPSVYTIGEVVNVSLLHTNGTYVSANLTVSAEARVADIEVTSLYQADDKVLEVGGASADSFKLILALKDQYGNNIASTTNLNNDILVTVTNTAVATVAGYSAANNSATYAVESIDGSDKVVLPLGSTVTAGTSTVTFISKTTGAKASFDVVVKAAIKVDTLTLSAPTSAPANSTVEIPFTAVDQFGNAIANPTDAQVNSKSITGGGAVTFVKDVVKGTTALKVTLGAKGTAILTILTGTNKVAQLTINVTDEKVPSVISGTKDLTTAVLKDATVTLATGNVVVKDQYNNDYSIAYSANGGTTAGEYRVVVSSSSSNVTVADTVYSNQSVTLTGASKGSATITLKLQKYVAGTTNDFVDVANSSYSFTFKVVEKADIVSYEGTVAGTVYAKPAAITLDYSKAVTVKGVLADESTVTIPNDPANYTVTVNTAGVTYSSGKVSATDSVTLSDGKAEVPVLVLVKGADTTELLQLTANVSNETPAVATLAVQTAGAATKVDDATISVDHATSLMDQSDLQDVITDAVLVKDQYGVVLSGTAYAPAYAAVVATNFSAHALGTLVEGDYFTVTAITNNNKTIKIKVIVEAN